MVAGGSDILVAAPGLNPVLNFKHKIDRRYALPAPLHDSEARPGPPAPEPCGCGIVPKVGVASYLKGMLPKSHISLSCVAGRLRIEAACSL